MKTSPKIRYAVYGLGHIAQNAVLPAFRHARANSELVALVSGDGIKLQKLGRQYRVKTLVHYDQYEDLLASGLIDAVYVATPNTTHVPAAELALKHGLHVLCEKPLSVDEASCARLVRADAKSEGSLMTAYRLHFESANLAALKLARSGKLGEPRIFNSLFTMQVTDRDNIRLDRSKGGGPLYDIGIYCINAARSLFGAEPLSVFAMSENNGERRFREVEEMVTATLRFPKNRIATFTASFGAAEASVYDLIGTKGSLRLENAYDYAGKIKMSLTEGERTTHRVYPKRDQFAPELVYFSDCILKKRAPEPGAAEGLADVRVIKALERSMRTGREVKLTVPVPAPARRLSPEQRIYRRPVARAPKLVHASDATG